MAGFKNPRELANRMACRRASVRADDGYVRETFKLPRGEARSKAKEFYNAYPKAAYMSDIETWRELPGDFIEFTMKRLRSAD